MRGLGKNTFSFISLTVSGSFVGKSDKQHEVPALCHADMTVFGVLVSARAIGNLSTYLVEISHRASLFRLVPSRYLRVLGREDWILDRLGRAGCHGKSRRININLFPPLPIIPRGLHSIHTVLI